MQISRLEANPTWGKPEIRGGNIDGLKELLGVAWKDLASPLLTPFERRERRPDQSIQRRIAA
ncbi:MAG TPA: hypothetical protein VLT36_06685 [Candidatus Dormibacteraeota bacterium]|nr:hypothetical protein [Candidatus Dormibacteraeota bacterium]